MSLIFSDVTIIAIIASVLIAVYLIGSYWKHKTLTRYARWFLESFSGKAKVQFASYGHAGIRVKCEMKEESQAFRELYFAITLGARENLMYYPLAPIMNESDKINCWGIVNKAIRSSLRIISAKNKRQVKYSESRANLRKLDLKELEEIGYVVYASNKDYSENFLRRSAIISKLKEFKEVELIELDMMSSMIRVVSKLKSKKLPDLTNFVLSLGKAA